MAETTKIQWCDGTVNPVMGCSGCELYVPGKGGPCYAGCDHERKGQVSNGYAPEFLLPTLFPGRVAKSARLPDLAGTKREDKPWLDGMPRLIFVSDMGDALSDKPYGDQNGQARHVRAEDVAVTRWGTGKNGQRIIKERTPKPGSIRNEGVPFDFLKAEIIDVATGALGSRHLWLWLTKLPKRMAEFSRWLEAQGIAWPENVWAGTSVTGTGTVWRAHEALGVGDDRTVRFLSVEPQWNEVSLRDVFAKKPGGRWWVIGGGESRQRKDRDPPKFDLAWVRKLRDECREFGAAFFLKQLGGNPQDGGKPWILEKDPKHGGDWSEWPEDLRLREMPTARRELSSAAG